MVKVKRKYGSLTEQELIKIAKNFKTRTQFQKRDSGAYNKAYKLGILDKICNHMISQNYSSPQLLMQNILESLLNLKCVYNSKKIIPPLELDIYFKEFKLAFEYNGKRWHKNNKNDSIKKNKCKEKCICLIVVSERSNNYEKDIKKQLIDNLDLINKTTNKDLLKIDIEDFQFDYKKVFKNIIDLDDIKNTISKYNSLKEFRKNEKVLYGKLGKLKMRYLLKNLDKSFEYWTEKNLKKEISKYTYLLDFIKNSKGAYLHIKRFKLDYLLKPLKRKINRYSINLIKQIINENNIFTLYQLKLLSGGAYNYVRRNNLQKEIINYINNE